MGGQPACLADYLASRRSSCPPAYPPVSLSASLLACWPACCLDTACSLSSPNPLRALFYHHAYLSHPCLQLSQLSALARLETVLCGYTADGMAVLTALTSLRCLRLYDNDRLPACLPALTWLEQLVVHSVEAAMQEELNMILPRMQRPTSLSLRFIDYQHFPPALANLSRLQRLCFWGKPADDADLRLPVGPWLASIRWLGLPWEVLDLAMGGLTTVSHLEYLCVCVLSRVKPPCHSGEPPLVDFCCHSPAAALPGVSTQHARRSPSSGIGCGHGSRGSQAHPPSAAAAPYTCFAWL